MTDGRKRILAIFYCQNVPESNEHDRQTLEKKYTELEYGSKDYDAGENPVLFLYHHREWIIQHEMDHLDGTTIKDIGILFDFNSLIQ